MDIVGRAVDYIDFISGGQGVFEGWAHSITVKSKRLINNTLG